MIADPTTPLVIYDDEDDTKPKVFIGGRKSKLAVIQSKSIATSLKEAHPDKSFPVLAISTLGDQVMNKPLYSFGGKALWTKELEILLLNKVEDYDQLDMIVHCLKDMPTTLPDGCELGAIAKREDPRDAYIMKKNSPYKSLSDLPDGSVIGTSSIRRSAQLKHRYPKFIFESIRGNIQTRLDKLDSSDGLYSCIILAAAGLNRLELESRITGYLESPDMYYAVGQGALGIEIRSDDERIKKLLSETINHIPTSFCCKAERSLMRTLEGGCSVPLGVETTYDEYSHKLVLKGIVISVDATECVEDEVQGLVETDYDAEELGKQLAEKLIEKGAKKILDEIHFADS